MENQQSEDVSVPLEVVVFVSEHETITAAKLQIKFHWGYMHANKVIAELLRMKLIIEPEVKWHEYIVNC